MLIAGAHGALLASRWRFPGEALSRESLTQDSRSAVKARLFDPLRESFGEERCAPRGDGVMAFKRPSRGLEPAVTRRNAAQTQRGGRCARTSLAVTTRARSAMRTRYGLTPRRACELDGSQHTSGAKAFAHAAHGGGDLGVGLRRTAGRRLRLSADITAYGGNAQRSRETRWSRRIDGDARTKHRIRARNRAAPATVRLHQTYRFRVKRRIGTPLQTR